MIGVTCAIIIDKENKILATQRSASMKLPLKWEFPGGKIEAGETPEECLTREIKEELNIDINITGSLQWFEHHYETFSIRLFPFLCEVKAGEIKLTEHSAYVWLRTGDLVGLDWAEADLPLVKELLVIGN